MPTVDCIISTYNRAEHFLPRAVRSVLTQTHRDLVLWIADDCSTDQTARLARQWIREDPRVRYVCTVQNSGYQCAPKNLAIRSGDAPYIAYLDDDNAWAPTHLERLLSVIGEAEIAYCAREWRNDPRFPAENPPILGAVEAQNNWPWDPRRIHFENWIDTADILHTRETIVKLNGWNETVRRAADWDVMRRAADAGMRVVHLPEVLTTYYWHSKQNIGRVPLNRTAIWTLTKNRLYFVQRAFRSLHELTGLPFDHFVLDQGSTDGTAEWLADEYKADRLTYLRLEPQNVGISRGSNHLLDLVLADNCYSWVCKYDSDIEMQTPGWVERIAQRWLPKHVLSPRILGLVHHPGGAKRTGSDPIRRLGYVKHLGGAVNIAPIDAWRDFGRWVVPAPAHGMQDSEFSTRIADKGWKMAHVEDVLALHLGNTPADVRARERAEVI